jgi:hypothetical protein
MKCELVGYFQGCYQFGGKPDSPMIADFSTTSDPTPIMGQHFSTPWKDIIVPNMGQKCKITIETIE